MSSFVFFNFMKEIFYIYFLLTASVSSVKFSYGNSIVLDIVEMNKDIILKYFNKSRCVILLSEHACDLVYISSVVVPVFVFRLQANDAKSADELILHALDENCDAFFICSTRRRDIITSILNLYHRSVQRSSRKFVFLPAFKNGKLVRQADAVSDLFSMREMKYVPDMIICEVDAGISGNPTRVRIVTGEYNRKSSKESLVGIWSNKERFTSRSDLFPDKIRNLNGMTMYIATFHYEPYVIIDPDADSPVYDGTEMRIGLEFSKWVNATYEFVVDAENEWGEIWENGTGNGILGTVVEDKADLGYGALYLWLHEYQYLDYSSPYIRTGITCLAPRPEKLPSWMTVILPFSLVMWVAVGVSLLLAITFHYIFSKMHQMLQEDSGGDVSVEYSALHVIGLLLLQTPDNNMRVASVRGPNRHHVNWLHFMFMLLTSSYAAGLASVLTVPRYMSPIDTVEDLARSNVRWAATHEAWVFSLREATDPLTVHVYNQFVVMKEEELKRRSVAGGDLAFSVERLPAGHYAIGSYITETSVDKLRLMKEDIYWEQCVIVTRKGSPFMDKLNTLIHRLLDTGLLLAWEGQVVRHFLRNKVQRAVHGSSSTSADNEPTTLKTEHVEGPLFILLFGLSLALVIFIGEISVSEIALKIRKVPVKYKRRQNYKQ